MTIRSILLSRLLLCCSVLKKGINPAVDERMQQSVDRQSFVSNLLIPYYEGKIPKDKEDPKFRYIRRHCRFRK